MLQVERMIHEEVKKAEKMELMDLISMVHDEVNKYFGCDFDVTIQKTDNQWKIVDYNSGYEVLCATLRECYESLYEDTLYKKYQDDIDKEQARWDRIDEEEREKDYWDKQLYR